MPWIEATLRGERVLARANEDGTLAADRGRVEIRYRASDSRAYRAATRNLEVPDGARLLDDASCHKAEPTRGSPAPVPPIRDAIDAALQKLPMRGTFQVVARNNTWTVRLSDHRDAAQVNAALKPIEAQMGVRVKVDVVGEAVANSATQR